MPSLRIPQLLEQASDRLGVRPSKLGSPLKEMLIRNWYLPFTCFGGPAVHVQIVRLPRLPRLQRLNDLG